ncbi:hypothetical protein Tco_0587515 [Tanacetum coccineum]
MLSIRIRRSKALQDLHYSVKNDSIRSGMYTDADDADIRPIYDEEPMAEVQLTAEFNIFAIGQQHTAQPNLEIIVARGYLNQMFRRNKVEPDDVNVSGTVCNINKKISEYGCMKKRLMILRNIVKVDFTDDETQSANDVRLQQIKPSNLNVETTLEQNGFKPRTTNVNRIHNQSAETGEDNSVAAHTIVSVIPKPPLILKLSKVNLQRPSLVFDSNLPPSLKVK